MTIRGIRGAITIDQDRKDDVIIATQELLKAILQNNPDMRVEDIASVFFTVTEDITSVHPALAARQMGWNLVPMICAREIPIPDSLPLCIRVLILWNNDHDQADINHAYLRNAVILRPDLVDK